MRAVALLLALAGGLAVAPAATATSSSSSSQPRQQHPAWSAALLSSLPVPSTIAPAAASQEPSCGDLLLQAAALRCRLVASSARLVVTLCSEQAGDDGAAQGLLLLQQPAAAATAADGRPVFRLRLLGPELLLPPLQHCTGGLAVGAVRITLPGSFHAEVLQLYEDFSYAGSPRLLPVPKQRAATFELHVSSGAALAAAGSKACTPGGACPPCGSHSALGRWVVADAGHPESRALLDALSVTCVHGSGGGCEQRLRAALAAAHNSSKRPPLAWQPYACRYRHVSGRACRARLEAAGRAVCFLGDPNAARMHDRLAHMLQGHASSLAAAAAAAASRMVEERGPKRMHKRTPKGGSAGSGSDRAAAAAAATQLLRFVPLGAGAAAGVSGSSSNPTESVLLAPAAARQLRGCGWLFASHGEQLLAGSSSSSSSSSSSKDGSFAGLLAGYAAQLELLAQQLVVVQRLTGATPLWLTAPAAPLTQASVDGAGGAADPQLLLLNKVAASIMQRHDIGVADTHSISAPLADLPRDASHFVAAAQAQMLAGIVCDGGGAAESGS